MLFMRALFEEIRMTDLNRSATEVTLFKTYAFKRSVLYFCLLDYIPCYFLISPAYGKCQFSLNPCRMIYISSFLSSNRVSSLRYFKYYNYLSSKVTLSNLFSLVPEKVVLVFISFHSSCNLP